MNDIRVFTTPLDDTHIPLFIQQRVKRIISPGKLSYLKRYRYLRKGTPDRLLNNMPPLVFFQKPSRNHSRRYRKLHSALGRLVLQMSSKQSDVIPNTVEFLTNVLQKSLILHIHSALRTTQEKEETELDEFTCHRCLELLYNPVTILCGHTMCHECVKLLCQSTCSCPICNRRMVKPEKTKSLRNNLVLSHILQKWHSTEWKARALTHEASQLLDQKEYDKAITKLTEALRLTPYSHVAYLQRAKAYIHLNNLRCSLEDSTRAIFFCRTWAEAYFIKGEVLYRMNFVEESFIVFLLCLVLEPGKTTTLNKIHKIIEEILSSIAPLWNRLNLSGLPHPFLTSPKKRRHLTETPASVIPPQHKRKRNASDDVVLTSHLGTELDYEMDDIEEDVVVFDAAKMSPRRENCKTGGDDEDSGKDGCPTPPPPSNCKDENHQQQWSSLVSTNFKQLQAAARKENINILDQNGVETLNTRELEQAFVAIMFAIDKTLTGDMHMLCDPSLRKHFISMMNLPIRPTSRSVQEEQIDVTDFECVLCMRLFYDPICTSCGHVFCQTCIERCLDHNARCPLCKSPMEDFLAESLSGSHHSVDFTTKAITQQFLPSVYEDRRNQHREEIKELTDRQPFFVCTIAFPAVPCPLHIFEPRYRLMLRRCLAYNQREFGMCMPLPNSGHYPVGTVLKVRNVTFFPDGRSVVDCVGERRFNAQDSELKDGYHVAKLSYIVDQDIGDEQAVERLRKIRDKVYTEAQEWFESIASNVRERILSHFGPFPEKDDNFKKCSGSDWLWWVVAVLPVEDRVKATILGKTVFRERLLIVHRIFTCIQQKQRQGLSTIS